MIYMIGSAIAGSLSSYLWTARTLRRTRQKGIFDFPNGRSPHSVPTPVDAGIAMVGSTLVLWLVYLLAVHLFDSYFRVFATGGLAVAMFGWIDDAGTAGCSARFFVHSPASVLALLHTDRSRFNV